jgi:autonomous glycyl radical cofactor GrcA
VFDKVRFDPGNSPQIVNVSDVFPVTYKDVTAPGRCHTRVRQFRGAQSLDTQIGRLNRIEFSKTGRPTDYDRYVYYNIRVNGKVGCFISLVPERRGPDTAAA